MGLLFLLLVWLTFGYLSAHFAQKRGRNPGAWFFLGVLFGLIALAALFLLPPLNQKGEELPAEPRSLAPPERPPLPDQWYYLDLKRQQRGPLSLEDLAVARDDGAVRPDTFLWTEGMESWQRLSELPDLREHLENPL